MSGQEGMTSTGAGGDARRGATGTEDALERRLAADEARLGRDEARLAADEYRLAEDETWIRRGWFLGLALGVLLLLTIAALVLAVVALNRDIEAVAKADPKDGSVGTAALGDDAVTGPKIAAGAVGSRQIEAGAVTAPALADGSVRARAIAVDAVTARALADDAVTGRAVDESTLGAVPRARAADSALTAQDSAALGGVTAAGYVRGVRVVTAATATSTLEVKGPLTATYPAGTLVISGGASVDGARRVAITTSTPDGRRGWTAEATAIGSTTGPWRLEATAVCATGGG